MTKTIQLAAVLMWLVTAAPALAQTLPPALDCAPTASSADCIAQLRREVALLQTEAQAAHAEAGGETARRLAQQTREAAARRDKAASDQYWATLWPGLEPAGTNLYATMGKPAK